MKKFDKLWHERLVALAATSITQESNRDFLTNDNSAEYVKHRKLVGTPIPDLKYADDTYFNQRYLAELDVLLRDFNKKSRYEQKLVQKKLYELYGSEGYWKNLTKKSQHEFGVLKGLFVGPEKKFIEFNESFINPSEETLSGSQRAPKNYAPTKLLAFFKGFLQVLMDEGQLRSLEIIRQSLTLADVSCLLNKNELSWIFYDLTRIVLSKTYENLYSSKKGLQRTGQEL